MWLAQRVLLRRWSTQMLELRAACNCFATAILSASSMSAASTMPDGAVRPNAPFGNGWRIGGKHAEETQARQSVPILQFCP